MENNKLKIKSFGDSDDYYIHFSNTLELEKFINYGRSQNLKIGHRCCGGKGCMVKEFGGIKIEDYNQTHDIQSNFSPPCQQLRLSL